VIVLNIKNIENMDKVIKEIGTGPICENESLLGEVQDILLDKGYAAAEVYVSQRAGSDEQDEIGRALAICQKFNISQEAAAEVVKKLNVIKSGEW
jgi:hypothetical protein